MPLITTLPSFFGGKGLRVGDGPKKLGFPYIPYEFMLTETDYFTKKRKKRKASYNKTERRRNGKEVESSFEKRSAYCVCNTQPRPTAVLEETNGTRRSSSDCLL